ncbi:MAG: enoyl-CoA hydratase/isomerase family protein [Acidimicrobiales bacterium]
MPAPESALISAAAASIRRETRVQEPEEDVREPGEVCNDEVLWRREGRVGWIVLNRPHARNSLTMDMYQRVAEIMAKVDADRDVRAVVFTGAGEEAFAAGTDIAHFQSFRGAEDILEYEKSVEAVLESIESVRVPTIAAIRGACVGGGAAIASTCDVRLASPSARMGFPIARTLGNCLSLRGYARLVDLVGSSRVKEMIFSSRLIGAAEAHEIGWVQEVVESEGDLLPRAEEMAARYASRAPLTIEATKKALVRIRESHVPDGDDLVLMCYLSRDFREAVSAFLAKERPTWRGE